MDTKTRLAAGLADRTIQDKLNDPNRPTWEQYKKDNEDKLNMGGMEAAQMAEYRKQLDLEREKKLSQISGTGQRMKYDLGDDDEESEEEEEEDEEDGKKKSKKASKKEKKEKKEKKKKEHKEKKKKEKKEKKRLREETLIWDGNGSKAEGEGDIGNAKKK
jgi:outer membrane biosynthesis protein TonB